MKRFVVLEDFVKRAPLAVMTRAILSRLLSPEQSLQEVFENSRGRGYEDLIPFAALAISVADIALAQCENLSQAYRQHREKLGATLGAYYGKVNRVEPSVSEGLVTFAANQSAELLRAVGATPQVVLPGYQCSIIDGNHLPGTQKRLKVLRKLGAAALPGIIVSKFNLQTRLFERSLMIEDAHAQESSVLDRLVADLQPRELILADRHYCIVRFLAQLAERQCGFVIRQHGRLKGELLGERREIGRIETGTVFEQELRIQGVEGDSLVVRRVTVALDRPTRDGAKELHLVTNLPREDADACQVANLYRQRWEVERAFYVLTTTLTCELASLSQPRAALFLFAAAQLAFNARQVLMAFLRRSHGAADVESLSHYLLSLDIERPMLGLLLAVPETKWRQRLPSTIPEFVTFLLRVSQHVDVRSYRKSRRGPKRPPPPRSRCQGSTHVATARLLARHPRKSTPSKM